MTLAAASTAALNSASASAGSPPPPTLPTGANTNTNPNTHSARTYKRVPLSATTDARNLHVGRQSAATATGVPLQQPPVDL